MWRRTLFRGDYYKDCNRSDVVSSIVLKSLQRSERERELKFGQRDPEVTSREERSGVHCFVTSSFTQSDHQTLNDKCTKTWEISLNIYTYRYRQKPEDPGDVRDKGSLKMVTEVRCDSDRCENL